MTNPICVILAIIVAALSIVGCGTSETKIPQSEWEKLVAIRGEARDFLREITLDNYNAATGAAPSERDAIYARYDKLWGDDNLKRLQRIEDSFTLEADEAKARRLRMFLLQSRIDAAELSETAYLEEIATQEKVKIDGRDCSPSQIAAELATNPNHDDRSRFYDAIGQVRAIENAVLGRMLDQRDSIAMAWGYGSLVSMIEDALDVDYATLGAAAERFLRDSDSLYRELAADWVPRLSGVPLDQWRGADLSYSFGADPFRQQFSRDSVAIVFARWMSEMGINPDTLRAIEVQIMPLGTARSQTYVISLPTDIRVVVADRGGSRLYGEYFHEMGHALHALFTTERELEYTQLGSSAICEAAAFMIEGVLDEPDFVKRKFHFTAIELAEYLRWRAFTKLGGLRRYCADVVYEQALYSEADSLATFYQQIQEPALGYAWSATDSAAYLRRLIETPATEYVRGWWLASMLRERLIEKSGEDYWNAPETGAVFKSLWASGRRRTADQVALDYDLGPLDGAATLRHLIELAR